MRRHATVDSLEDSNENIILQRNVTQNLLQAPISYEANIISALHDNNFRYHRPCSATSLVRNNDVGEGRIISTFWFCDLAESTATASMMSAPSDSSFPTTVAVPQDPCGKETRCILQQTDISCRLSPGMASPVSLLDANELRAVRARLAESLTRSSPVPSPALSRLSPLSPAARSISILGSVCALLLSKQGSSAAKVDAEGEGAGAGEAMCRICFGGESASRLVRPCLCRGTVACVHRVCLERWLLHAATSYCELCRHHYRVTRTHKWSWLRSLVEWLRSGRGQILAGDVWRGAALAAACVLGTSRALHACDRLLQAGARRGGPHALAANLISSILIGIIGALNGLLTTWMLLKIQEHQLSWRAWRDSTLHVHVALEEEYLTPQISETTVVPEEGPRNFVDRSTNVADPFMFVEPTIIPE